MELEDGTRVERNRGTPQGGIVSPVLANLFLHYAFDAWMKREYPELPWCRYADDGLVHCRTLEEAEAVKAALQRRLAECSLEMHPEKTRIIYCKDRDRTGKYPKTSFDFLRYTFRPRKARNRKRNSVFLNFTPAFSNAALTNMRRKIWELHLCNWTQTELKEIARQLNPILCGWIEYYGRYRPSALHPLYRHVNKTLVRWAMRKYKRFKGKRTSTGKWLEGFAKSGPRFLVYWSRGTTGAFT